MDNKKILVVEDQTIVAMDIENRLVQFGYTVVGVALTGEEAIEMTSKTQPDLVLMDIMLKGDMDGVEAGGQIRERYNIPLVYLTAYADDKTLHRAKITEPFGYILKPFEERELHSNIEIAMYKHRMERKLKESEQWYAATLNSIGDAVIATDRDGYVKFMNPFAEALTGWRMGEAVKKPLTEVFNVISRRTGKQVEDPVLKAIHEGNFFGLADQTLLITKDSTQIPIDIIGSHIKDDNNNILGAVMIFYSISDRIRAEEEIMRSTQGLRSISV